jgi:predicted secreted protein
MPLATYLAIYFVVWWMCLFVVLPFRVRNQVDEGAYIQGTERGAPAGILNLWPKILATTLLAAVVTGLLLWALSADWLQRYWN